MKIQKQTGLKNIKPKINLNHNIYIVCFGLFSFIFGDF